MAGYSNGLPQYKDAQGNIAEQGERITLPPSLITHVVDELKERREKRAYRDHVRGTNRPPRFARLNASVSHVRAVAGTVIGMGAFSVAAFQAGTIVGWCVVGVSVLVVDWKADKS